VRAGMAALVLALCACSLGPWVAALWATGGFTEGGSSRWLRRIVKILFWLALGGALLIVAWALLHGHRRGR
jgi:hypothetical protein